MVQQQQFRHIGNKNCRVKTLEPICTTGNNSPTARPEFVDISLNTTTGPAENGLPEDEGVEEEE